MLLSVSLLNFIRKNINFKTEVTNDNLEKISTYSNYTYLFIIFSSLIIFKREMTLKKRVSVARHE